MGLQRQLEVEAKYSVDATAAAPDISSVPGITRVTAPEVVRLSATYFDTEDLRLSRAKIALRRRTGGHDEGWHIKVSTPQGRRETHAPLSEDVPPELLQEVRAIVRNSPLIAVARVDNERHLSFASDSENRVLLELCDDHVHSVSYLEKGTEQRWREWEIEATACAQQLGQADSLLKAADSVVRAQGATDPQSGSKLQSALGDSAFYVPSPRQPAVVDSSSPAFPVLASLQRDSAALIQWDPRVRRDEPDAVHQMRVITRQLRSNLHTFREFFAPHSTEKLEAKLKQLAAVLGNARDCEVVKARFRFISNDLAASLLDESTRDFLHHGLDADYAKAHRRINLALNDQRYFDLLNDIDSFLAYPPLVAQTKSTDSSFPALVESLDEAYAAMQRRYSKAAPCYKDLEKSLPEYEETFHDLRKSVKKFRYAADAIGSSTPLATKKLVRACKKLQTDLGEFQDTATSRVMIHKAARHAELRGVSSFGLGIVYSYEYQRAVVHLRAAKKSYKEVAQAYKDLQKKAKKKKK
ncbi:CYTH and CHAD domain-containing protein [Corynebacterium diphtheriae]|nr:CYTH and CHAD domain-containing protein [Corynebacterium diphtheriae]